jgi:hypothetical protein
LPTIGFASALTGQEPVGYPANDAIFFSNRSTVNYNEYLLTMARVKKKRL